MRETVIKTFVEFVEEMESFDLLANLVIFRGQPEKGNLLPNLVRDDPTTDTTKKEREVLEQLKLQGTSLLNGSGTSDLELLVTAQHFGLKTRLLDWTSNPLAALWFACEVQKKGDVYVYALEADNLLEKNVYEKDPFATAKTRVFQPRLNNPRIVAQHGWFTLHRFSKRGDRFISLEKNKDSRDHLHEFRIPSKRRSDILKSLDRHGISAKTIYPDLAGLCNFLNWKHFQA